MKKLSIYGTTKAGQDEPVLLAEIKLHRALMPDQNSRRRIMEVFRERGASVLSILVHEEVAFELG